ncbi:tpsC1 domain protein [Neisseria meningitidis 2002030]|nr:tpsC1 domain protein [Neisseria meningitidis 2002030]
MTVQPEGLAMQVLIANLPAVPISGAVQPAA